MAKAASSQGLHFTASTHQHESWDWFHRSYNFDKDGPLAGVPWDAWQTKRDGKGKWWEGYSPADLYVYHFLPWDTLDVIRHKMARSNRNDWPNDRDILDARGNVIATVKVDPDAQAKFARNWYLRTKDLIDKYHPEILYFDLGLPFSPWACRDAVYLRLQAHYYNSSLKWNDGRMLVGANLKHIKDWPVEWQTGTHYCLVESVAHWSLVRSGTASASMQLDASNPVNTTGLTTSLRLDADQASESSPVGVANDGYWGIPVWPNTKYRATLLGPSRQRLLRVAGAVDRYQRRKDGLRAGRDSACRRGMGEVSGGTYHGQRAGIDRKPFCRVDDLAGNGLAWASSLSSRRPTKTVPTARGSTLWRNWPG